MTLKWVYAAMVIAAALVLGFALQDGRPAHEVAGSQRAPEPRVVGGGRTDLALPGPSAMPRREATPEAEPAAEADRSTPLPEAEAPRGTPPAARSRQIAAQPPVERSELEASGGVGRRRAMPAIGGAGGSAAGGTVAETATAPFVPQAVSEAPPAEPAVAEIPTPVASAPVPPRGPELPDLSGTPDDQRLPVIQLIQGEFEDDQQAAKDWVGQR